MKGKIIQEKSKCIGCGTCVSICSKYFEMTEDGKAVIKGANYDDNEKGELEIEEMDACAKEAADSCPVQCIQVEE